MKLIVDIDGTICTKTDGDYSNAQPYTDRIEYLNNLYNQGSEIHYWTARGSVSGKNYLDLTLSQLNSWGVKYTTCNVGKPAYDYWIDDKAINAMDYFK